MFMLQFGKRKKIILICFLFNIVLELKYIKLSIFYNYDSVSIKRTITLMRRGNKLSFVGHFLDLWGRGIGVSKYQTSLMHLWVMEQILSLIGRYPSQRLKLQ